MTPEQIAVLVEIASYAEHRAECGATIPKLAGNGFRRIAKDLRRFLRENAARATTMDKEQGRGE